LRKNLDGGFIEAFDVIPESELESDTGE